MSLLKRWRDRAYQNIYGTETIARWGARYVRSDRPRLSVLDVGCGAGRDLLAVKAAIGASSEMDLYGIECTEELIKNAAAHGVRTYPADLETASLPFADNTFDLVMANQVLEHLKNWLWAFNEQVRVTRPGGLVIIGVPNLAALHNRALILLGRQPSCIKADGPHVRGFTSHELRRLGKRTPGLEIVDTSGTLVYGVPPFLGKRLGVRLPSLSATILLAFRKTAPEVDLLCLLDDAARFETNYFVGNRSSA